MTLDEYIDIHVRNGHFDLSLNEKDFIAHCKKQGICGGCYGDFWDEWNGIDDFSFQRGKIRTTDHGLQWEEDYRFTWKQLYKYIKDRKEEKTQITFW